MFLLLALAGCGAVQELDSAMRRVDVLDRVFQPERFRPPPPAPTPDPPFLAKGPEPEAAPEPAPEPAHEPAHEPAPETAPEAAPVRAEPIPDPGPPVTPATAPTPAERLRRNPWLARFWGELTPNQQARVSRRLPGAVPAEAWDRMGLDDRLRLVFGAGG